MAVRASADDRKLRAGVVGAGHMGQYHLLAYAEFWDIELAGVVDTDRERAAQVAAYYDTRALMDHRDLIGDVERFNGAVQELRKIVERPILIESRRLGPFTPRVQKDSVVMDLMIHDLDIVLGLVDSPPRRLTAMGSTVHSGSVDVATVQIAFESGTLAIITASRATEEKIRTLAVTQPDAYVVLDYSEQDIRIHRRAAQEYTLNRESIRYRRASFDNHVQLH